VTNVSEPSFFPNPTPDQALREAQLMLLHNMSRTLESITAEMLAQRKDMSGIILDVAVIKERQQAQSKIEELYIEMRKDIDAIKARNFQQDGAMSAATLMKDFGPWLISLGVVFWSLFINK